jgi:nitrogenase-associated protein
MTHVVFYEKPGCANNTRQKAWLQAAGHVVEARSLIAHAWTRQELLAFMGDRPVAQWWNRAAPRIKSGEIVPNACDRDSAIALMLADPLLIRRPLISAEGRREVGFDVTTIHAWLGLPQSVVESQTQRDAEACVRAPSAAGCEPTADKS